jgi:hypothetical protein
MRTTAVLTVAIAVLAGRISAQETKPVPKDSMRVAIPGCTKGYIFTAAPRSLEEAGSVDVPEGMHFRMNGPKKLMSEIKAYEGQPIVVTGLVKKGQTRPDGVAIGGGVRIGPGPSGIGSPGGNQAFIDVEGWRPAASGVCRSR